MSSVLCLRSVLSWRSVVPWRSVLPVLKFRGPVYGALALQMLTSPFWSSAASAMEFATVPMGRDCHTAHCPRAVIAEGEITGETPAKFTQFLKNEMRVPGLHAVVFINSPGGNVESALKLGALLHDAGAAAVVGRPLMAGQASSRGRSKNPMSVSPGQCASACVYTLMGAKRRVVPDGARLGVHRMSARIWGYDPAGGRSESGRVFAGSPEIQALRTYVARVGGSQDLISLAESVPHDRIRVLSSAEVRRYRLGTPKL